MDWHSIRGWNRLLSNGDVFFQLDRIALLGTLSQDTQASVTLPDRYVDQKDARAMGRAMGGIMLGSMSQAHSIVLLDNADIRCPRTV